MDLYLITGFLGAGKTTTIKEVLKIFEDKKVALIINEFGKTGVDGKILNDISTEVFEVAGGSIFCTCKINQFENVLGTIIKEKPEVIIVETSGLSDPTSAYKILSQDKFSQVSYKGCICIVDALYLKKVIKTARVSKKQVRISDLIIINKIDLVNDNKIDEVKQLIYEINPFATIEQTSHGNISPHWILNLHNTLKDTAQPNIKDINLITYELTIDENCTKQELIKMLESFIEDTYRVKGFLKLKNGKYLINCVGDSIIIEDYQGEILDNKLVILSCGSFPIGKSLQRTEEMYCQILLKIAR
ncbi:hypothetical protein AN641_03915 [Candidatus Epulonipiscioides gigas]|nr:hypothetical protein AN641_03915 [Epulopiscium sp. SCG-C07WGA-EpuloA2]